MPQPKNKSVFRTTTIPLESPSTMDNKGYFVLDHSTTCTDWHRLWSSFGFSEHQWSSRAVKVEEYSRKLLDNKLLTYKEQLTKRRKLLKQSVEDYEDLVSRTGLPSLIDTSVFDGLKLKEQEIYIDKKTQELSITEGELIHRRTELEIKQNLFCTLLNTTPIEFDENIPMSLVEINQKLEDHIKMLSELKDLRLTQISSYYLTLKQYSEQLEWTPPQSSTVEFVLLEKFDRCLTVDCLNEIETTIHDLENQVETQKTRFHLLHNQLGHLYECLGKDPCLAYKTGDENINAFSLKQLEHEIACCREERMKNGKEYCQSIHQQITELIEKAHLGDDERAAFDKFDFETLSPDLLDAYDAEFDRISRLYEKRKSVIDAYEKWFSFWNDFVAFTKASTDPGRFHIRGYNAEAEGRKRKKFHRELPVIEQEFLNILSENNDPSFRIGNVPIRQKFDEAHQQVPPSAMPSKMVIVAAPPPHLLSVTPVQSRTPAATPRRVAILGTGLTSAARRGVKTPSTTIGRKLLNKVASHTECQAKRAKPRAPPLSHASPPHPIPALPVHPPARTDDQALDFSLLHTMKSVHGQMKVMTSTPNSSFITKENQNGGNDKTAHNTIGRRKSKRRSRRIPVPLVIVQEMADETVVCL